MNTFRIVAVVLVAFALLLPTSVGAESDAPYTVFVPLAMAAGTEGPEMVQFRSCGGVNGVPLQFQEVPVGNFSALSEDCEGGTPYPGPLTSEGWATVLGGYYMGELNWHSVPSLILIEGQDAIFEMTFAKGDSSPSTYLNVRERDGGLSIDQGGVVITEPTTIEGWDISFHLDAAKPYIQLSYEDGRLIWVTLQDNGSLWAEIRTPRVVTGDSLYAWGIWFEACKGEFPSLEDITSRFTLDRYQLSQ